MLNDQPPSDAHSDFHAGHGHPPELPCQANPKPHNNSPQYYGLSKPTFKASEARYILSIGRTTLYKLIKEGKLRPTKLGKTTLFYAQDLADFLASLQQEGQ